MTLVRLLRSPSYRQILPSYLRFFCSTNTSAPSPTSILDPPPLTNRAVNTAIDSLYKEHDLDKFLSRFHHYTTSSPLFRSKPSVYEVAVLRLAEAGRLDDVTAIIDALKSNVSSSSESSEPKSPAFLISLYGKAGMVDSVWEAFRQLPQTMRSFNALLAALGGESDAILEALRAVPLEFPEIVPDVFSHSIAIGALCREGKLDPALDHLKVMEEKGVVPNVVTFNTLLHASYTKNQYDEAEKIWQLMEERSCSPNPRSYNTKLRWLVNNGKTDDAVKVFGEMESRGLKPDGYSLTALIMGYCKDGKLKEAKKLYGQIRRRNCPRNPWMYEALLPKLCEAGEIDMAFCLCNESLKNNCNISADVLQKVVDSLVEASRFRDSKKLVEEAWSAHYSKDVLKMPYITWEQEQQEKEKTAEVMESKKKMVVHKGKQKQQKEKAAEMMEPEMEMVVHEGKQNLSEEGAYAKIGIIVKSFEKPNYLGAFGIPLNKNRVKLPSTRSLITVLRSPHIDKKSREQFEMKVRREYMVIKCKPQELHKKYFWFKRTRIIGAQFELVFSYKTRLDMSRLQRPT